jgi:hypothetical protein
MTYANKLKVLEMDGYLAPFGGIIDKRFVYYYVLMEDIPLSRSGLRK